MDKKAVFITLLTLANERVSSARLALFTILATHGPLTTTALVERAKAQAINASTVYRNLSLFNKLHITNEIGYGNRKRIELSDQYASHHHHFVCQNCQKILDFTDAHVEQALNGIAARLRVQVSHHQVELLGLCPECIADRPK